MNELWFNGRYVNTKFNLQLNDKHHDDIRDYMRAVIIQKRLYVYDRKACKH